MTTFQIYDETDNELRKGFYMTADNKEEAEAKAVESGGCAWYGIQKPKAYTQEEVDAVLAAR